MYFHPYNKFLKKLSRELRNPSTKGEVKLWNHLKNRNKNGYQFYRQKILKNFIVDFYSPALSLVIEVDGAYHFHNDQYIKDQKRQKIIESLKLQFLRFTEKEVLYQFLSVIQAIEYYIKDFESGSLSNSKS
jgi:very-short-patch-repair endonuclease